MIERDEREGARPDEGKPISTRAAPPKPRRLSRKALALLTGVGAIAIAGALGYSLTASHHAEAPQESVTVDRNPGGDALADAPRDYGDLAKSASGGIGPPGNPGEPQTPEPNPDLGSQTSAPGADAASAEAQRRRQQRDSARSSKLFTGSSERASASSSGSEAAPPLSGQVEGPAQAAGSNPDDQDRKAAFVAGKGASPTVNAGRLMVPAGDYVIDAGSTIAAALITGLSSDLPGQVVAQVTENVYDSVTGQTLLIPQGTRLLGDYDARVSFGQSRALVVWTRMILPDGRSIALDRMVGTDPSGQSGFADRVHTHTGKLVVAGILSTLFGVGANVATGGGGSNGDIAYAIRESAGRSVESAGDKIVERQLDVQPTITIRPGARVRVLVGRDLVLAPWRTGGA